MRTKPAARSSEDVRHRRTADVGLRPAKGVADLGVAPGWILGHVVGASSRVGDSSCVTRVIMQLGAQQVRGTVRGADQNCEKKLQSVAPALGANW